MNYELAWKSCLIALERELIQNNKEKDKQLNGSFEKALYGNTVNTIQQILDGMKNKELQLRREAEEKNKKV